MEWKSSRYSIQNRGQERKAFRAKRAREGSRRRGLDNLNSWSDPEIDVLCKRTNVKTIARYDLGLRLFDFHAFGLGEQLRIERKLLIFPVPVNLASLVVFSDHRDRRFGISAGEEE